MLYMHLQNSKLLLKVGKNPSLIYLWFCLLGCIITEQLPSCAEQSGRMENYRLTSPGKHLTSPGDRQEQNISKNGERQTKK